MAQPNTITANITLSDKGPEKCIATAIIAEIIERLQGTVTFDDPSVAVISQSQPSQLNKIWFQTNSQGQVTNIKFYNPNTGKWEEVLSTTDEAICLADGSALSLVDGCLYLDPDRFLERSESSNNLIQFDSSGKIIVDIDVVRQLALRPDSEYDCNVLTKNEDTGTLRVKRGAGAYQSLGNPGAQRISGYSLMRNAPDPAEQTLDLEATFPNEWDSDCPPTHIQVTGVIAIGTGDGVSTGTWSSPACEIKAGHYRSLVAIAIDSDSTEGTCMNTMIVELDPADPKTFPYSVIANGSVDWVGDDDNEIGLYLQGFLWSGLDA